MRCPGTQSQLVTKSGAVVQVFLLLFWPFSIRAVYITLIQHLNNMLDCGLLFLVLYLLISPWTTLNKGITNRFYLTSWFPFGRTYQQCWLRRILRLCWGGLSWKTFRNWLAMGSAGGGWREQWVQWFPILAMTGSWRQQF